MTDLAPVIEGQIVLDLDQLAIAIREEHEACEAAYSTAVRHAIRAGELLTDAKAQVEHGEWLPWLAENFNGHQNLAGVYMRLAANSQRVGNSPSVRAAIAELVAPRDDDGESEPKPVEPTDEELISAALAPLAPADREQAMAEAVLFHGDTLTPAQVREIVAPYLWPDERQRQLRRLLADGQTVVVNLRDDRDIIAWATARGLLVKVDRNTPWGNPFELPADGDRAQVIAAYRDHYLPHKPSLHRKLPDLNGKALACWCGPEACHGDVLAEASRAA